MVKFNAFNRLSINKKCDLVSSKGQFLFKKFEIDCVRFLYFYNDFFIEIHFFEDVEEVNVTAFKYEYGRIETFIQDVDLILL